VGFKKGDVLVIEVVVSESLTECLGALGGVGVGQF
jgi:hypothetical protein